MSLHKVRHNEASFDLLAQHFAAYRAGQYIVRREQNMNQARNLKKKADTGPIVKLYVSFARDDHHHYLMCLREIKREFQGALQIRSYEASVMDRVMGVLHR